MELSYTDYALLWVLAGLVSTLYVSRCDTKNGLENPLSLLIVLGLLVTCLWPIFIVLEIKDNWYRIDKFFTKIRGTKKN